MFKSLISTVIGAAVGAAVGTVMVPVYWACDATALVSYPIMMATAANVLHRSCCPEKRVPKPVLLAGAAAGLCSIPFAPLNALARPITEVSLYTVTGAWLGYLTRN